MRQASKRVPESAEKTVRDIRRATRLYYRWSKEFLEAGKKRLAGDTAREATSDEVKELKAEARQLYHQIFEAMRQRSSCPANLYWHRRARAEGRPMRIDPTMTIYAAIDDELVTIDECLARMLRVWDAIEHSALEQAVAEAIAHGFNEDDVGG